MGNILNIINSDKHFHDLNQYGNNNYMRCLDGAFWSGEMKSHFKVNKVDIDNIDEKRNYIYLIECRQEAAIYSGLLQIPQKIIDLVNQDRCKVIFSYEAEGDLNINYFNGWYNLTCRSREDEIKFSNFYIFHCELNCEKNNETPINFFSSTHHFDSISFEMNKIKKNNNFRTVDDFDYNFKLNTIDDIDISNKSKNFLCYMRNCGKQHRKVLASYFQHNDLWDKNNISFLKAGYEPTVKSEYLPNEYLSSFVELDNLKLIELDTQNIKNKESFNTMVSTKWENYQETFLSVVSETIFTNGSEIPNNPIFFSEKMCKPLFNLHPFILMSTPYSLRKLKEFGFKTFGGFIDESYDNEMDNLKRTQMIFDELDKFRNKSDKELKDWWEEILPVLEHNQKTFINMGKQKTKKIKLLENLYD